MATPRLRWNSAVIATTALPHGAPHGVWSTSRPHPQPMATPTLTGFSFRCAVRSSATGTQSRIDAGGNPSGPRYAIEAQSNADRSSASTRPLATSAATNAPLTENTPARPRCTERLPVVHHAAPLCMSIEYFGGVGPEARWARAPLLPHTARGARLLPTLTRLTRVRGCYLIFVRALKPEQSPICTMTSVNAESTPRSQFAERFRTWRPNSACSAG